MTACLCGCGEEVKPGNKYVYGHYQRTRKLQAELQKEPVIEEMLIYTDELREDILKKKPQIHKVVKDRIYKSCYECGFYGYVSTNQMFCPKASCSGLLTEADPNETYPIRLREWQEELDEFDRTKDQIPNTELVED